MSAHTKKERKKKEREGESEKLAACRQTAQLNYSQATLTGVNVSSDGRLLLQIGKQAKGKGVDKQSHK